MPFVCASWPPTEMCLTPKPTVTMLCAHGAQSRETMEAPSDVLAAVKRGDRSSSFSSPTVNKYPFMAYFQFRDIFR